MKKYQQLIIGILLGGLLFSSGWFAWGAIQQEVGINFWNGSSWFKSLGVSTTTLNTPNGLNIRGNSSSDQDNVANLADGAIAVKSFNYVYEPATNNWQRQRTQINQIIEDVTTASTGTNLNLTFDSYKFYNMQIERTAGATDVVEIDLECSIAGVCL